MNCALCDADTNTTDTLAMRWDQYLTEERDYFIPNRVLVPLCTDCKGERWAHYRYQYRAYSPASPDEASELLDDLILNNLIQLDHMGEEIEY